MAMSVLKDSAKAALLRFGYRITSAPTLIDFLKSRSVTLVLDIGANQGQFAKQLRSDGYQGKIISFEPIKNVFDQLTDAMKGDDGWEGVNIALGDQPGTTTINVSQNTVYSSILSQASYATEHASSAATVRTEEIVVDTLDRRMLQIDDQGAIFCKIDTQGFEEAVLRGARSSLSRFCGLQLELPIEHLYKDCWSLSQAFAVLDSAGFVPAQVSPTSFVTGDQSSWTEMDCIFRRKSERH